MGTAERAGSGVNKILTEWSSLHQREPYVLEETEPDRIVLELPTFSIATYTINFSTLSVSNPETSNVSVYPNPVSEVLHIGTAINSATLYDMSGRQTAFSKSSEMNVSHLTKGIYLLKILTKDNKELIKKSLKSKKSY